MKLSNILNACKFITFEYIFKAKYSTLIKMIQGVNDKLVNGKCLMPNEIFDSQFYYYCKDRCHVVKHLNLEIKIQFARLI